MASRFQIAKERLQSERPSEHDRTTWCQGCASEYEAAMRYNGDMACSFGVCSRDHPGDSALMYEAVFTDAVIALQVGLNEWGGGDSLSVDGKFGPGTRSALKFYVGEMGIIKGLHATPMDSFMNKYRVQAVSLQWEAPGECPPCGAPAEESAPLAPVAKEESATMGLVVAAIGVGVLYWLYARKGRR
jgi:hypothetical protein